MQANETKLQKVIEGTVQYVIPLFQRTYSWDKKEWQVLWDDLVELCESDIPKIHFIGSIVSLPTVSVPEGVAKYLLIDGQQRLTTIFIILTLLRDNAKEENNPKLAEEIQERFLVNKFSEGHDFFKLMPTQADRLAFTNYVKNIDNTQETQITRAYEFFKKKLRQKSAIDPDIIKKIIISSFSIVSIVLDVGDNPYLVFESLNAKGRSLTQADLIRNYFFMRIHVNSQEEIFQQYWQPMQEGLGNNLTEFIRHFLMRKGGIVKQTDVYYSLKENVNSENVVSYLQELNRFSTFYEKLLNPEKEPVKLIKKYLIRLNRIEVTTAYPMLLTGYSIYSKGEISEEEFVQVLQILENYLIRRFVCSVATNQLNKIFSTVCPQLLGVEHESLITNFKEALLTKGYPKDTEFMSRFVDAKMYGGGDRAIKTKLILETLEESYQHKEMVDIDKKFTIEHVMPQTLTDWWQEHLGAGESDIHELYLHNIGNLTLTAYNTELSNDTFTAKCHRFKDSHLELNKYFTKQEVWNKDEIEVRAEDLATKALSIWAYLWRDNQVYNAETIVTGTSPTQLYILGEKISVASWRDVLEATLNTIAMLDPEKFDVIAAKYPKYIGKDKSLFRAMRELKNKYFVEVNLSAKDIQKLCNLAIETIDLTSEDWNVISN